jgi:hypothetical protein
MLNITALGLYMVFSGMTGTPVAAQVPEIPQTEPQVVEERKKDTIERMITTEAYVRNYFSDIPLMVEISRCESGFRQTDENGNVIRGKKNNKDVGAFQINEYYHAKTAKAMGIDLHTLEGNAKYARYLHEKEGAKPWMASSKCWTKQADFADGSSVHGNA